MILERLRKVFELSGKSQSELSRMLDVTPQYISKLLKGNQEPSERIILATLKAFPDINENWLRTGDGVMNLIPTRQAEIADVATKLYGADPESFEYKVAMYLKDLPIEEWRRFQKFIKDLSNFI